MTTKIKMLSNNCAIVEVDGATIRVDANEWGYSSPQFRDVDIKRAAERKKAQRDEYDKK